MSDKKEKFINLAMVADDGAELSAITAASEVVGFQTVAYPGAKPEESPEDPEALDDYHYRVEFAASEFARLSVDNSGAEYDPERLACFYQSMARTAMETGGQVVLIWDETLPEVTRAPGLKEFHQQLALNRELAAAGVSVV